MARRNMGLTRCPFRVAGLSLLLCSVCASIAQAKLMISSKPTQNVSCSAGVCSPTAKKAVLNATDLANMLAASDVEVVTDYHAKDISVEASFSWVSANRLTLDSWRSITFNKAITVAGSGALTIATNDGQVSATGTGSIVGGLMCGSSEGKVLRSHAAVAVSGIGDDVVGGLVGVSEGFCYGFCIGQIEQSYSTGTVSSGDGAIVGGLVGNNLGSMISTAYALGAATGGHNAFVGGLVGMNSDGDMATPILTDAYATGLVTAGSGATVGGLIGHDSETGQITDTYWDLDTSGINDPGQGVGNIVNDPGITGLTDAQLKAGLPAGFDSSIWNEAPNINSGFPYLLALPPG